MTLPGSTLEIFPVTLGGNPFGWTADEAASCAVLDTFAAAGGNIIDSADAYSEWVDGNVGGESETILGRWMASRGNRDQIMVATKVALLGARKGLRHDNVVAALDDSLRRLGTDHVDLYYAHYDDPDVAIHDQVATFDSLVRSGKARAIGLSNFTPERMREWFDTAQREGMTMPSSIQPRYSLMKRADYERDYAQIAAAHNVAVFSYPALASGFLTGKYRVEADFEGKPRGNAARRYYEAGGLRVVDILVEIAERHASQPASVAIAWLLAKGITAPIASASRPEQLEAIMAAPSLRLSDADVSSLDEASENF